MASTPSPSGFEATTSAAGEDVSTRPQIFAQLPPELILDILEKTWELSVDAESALPDKLGTPTPSLFLNKATTMHALLRIREGFEALKSMLEDILLGGAPRESLALDTCRKCASEIPEPSTTDAAVVRRSQDPIQLPLELIIKILDIYWRSIIDEMNGSWLPRSVRPVFCLSKSTLLYALTTITKMLEEARARIDDIEKWYPQYIHTEEMADSTGNEQPGKADSSENQKPGKPDSGRSGMFEGMEKVIENLGTKLNLTKRPKPPPGKKPRHPGSTMSSKASSSAPPGEHRGRETEKSKGMKSTELWYDLTGKNRTQSPEDDEAEH
ncbi:MAG: hypothetical protein Q9159_001043 [Coniocarpon cinnabarinum]